MSRGVGVESGDEFFSRAVGDQRRGAGGAKQAFRREIVGVSIAGALTGDDANAAAGADSLAGGLDQRLIDADRGRGDRLEVEVGIVAAGGERLTQAAFEEAFGKAEFLKKIAFVGGF